MEERKFIRLKKEEYGIKEYIKRDLGKGKISNLDIEYTPVGEKIIIHTAKPGLVIGRKGENIQNLTAVLKKRFKLENPHIEISEIEQPLFDAQIVADDIALALERMGNLKFKVIAYRKLQEIMRAGALGCELRLTGKLPSDRAKSWRFAEGYLKKAGDSNKEVDRAQATSLTKLGITGIKVAIMPPNAKIYDKIEVNDELRRKLGKYSIEEEVEVVKKGKKSKKRTKTVKKIEEDGKVEVKEESMETVQEVIDTKEEIKGDAIAVEQEIEEGVSESDDKAIEKAEIEEKKNEGKGKDGNEGKIEDGLDKDGKDGNIESLNHDIESGSSEENELSSSEDVGDTKKDDFGVEGKGNKDENVEEGKE
ncbi:30S ribosomal protein S3 [Candidatus Pacearchaeota archaeon]|nr:30S ribosomal protein S3 [Candidatus Pacearchaeota archaeon]